MNALYVLCGLGVVSLLAELVNLRKGLIILMSLGIAVAAGLLISDWNTSLHYFNDMVVFDNLAIVFTGLICVISIAWFWMSNDYFQEKTLVTDHTALILFAIAGGVMLTAFNNMAMLFLGIEILSISLYTLAGSKRESLFSNEAAFKYFLMGSFATGFLLMGIALVYGATGSFNVTGIALFTAEHSTAIPGFFYVGVLMILVGIAFKISAVPFHFWAPDVYEGSPTVITAFMSTIVKIAAFAAFIRLFAFAFVNVESSWIIPLQIITILTLVLANITAVYQRNVKRMLAYSSVGHAGYVLLAFVGGGQTSAGTIFYYLAVYAVGSILAFTVLLQIEKSGLSTHVDSFNGLFKKNAFLAVAMAIALLSLAGIPPLAGFFGKYLVFSLVLQKGHTALVILAIVTSLIGVYYYFGVIIAMFFKPVDDAYIVKLSMSHKVLISILIGVSLLLGLFPDLLRII
jgi:NADH-quinone oxidoreductase subunit N